MTTPTSGELALLRTQPHSTKLWLSIYKPRTILQAQVNDAGASKGDAVITYDNAVGDYTQATGGMTMYVGTTSGGKEKGEIWLRDTPSATEIEVGENSHINWEDDDYLTIINFNQIWPVYPRYTQSGGDITVYKFYDIAYYAGANENLGSFLVAGGNYAGFINQSTGSAQIYWDASESENVIGTTGTTYSWFFEGGTPTGSTSITPGWIVYDTPGHYRTFLVATEPGVGNESYAARFVSIYDRPEEGPNVPILSWGINEFSGSRDEGGYSARLWVKEDVDDVTDGALVVIFADDKYGTTEQSIGGNSAQRESIVFVGYILDGTIEHDYQTSTVTFEVGSPTEIMKIGEAFSVSIQDSSDPVADAGIKGGDPWFYLVNLSIKTALYHYYALHSTAIHLMDVRFVGDDFDLQFFDSDRTSLFDAGNTLLKSSKYGEMVCDRQGNLYFETNVAAINNAESVLTQNMFIDNHDWMDISSITERYTGEVSYLEAGGVAYTNYDGGGTGTFSAILSAAPGETPSYRGKNIKMSGLALTNQGITNTLVGNIWESMNAQYPEVSLDMVGNYRNLDIAPQEKVTVTLRAEDTFRGLSWVQKAFTPTAMSWNYDPEKGTFLPSLTLKEITQGNAGETIAIPVEPPEDGFEQPPSTVPPPIPPIGIPPLDWTLTPTELFVPAIGGDNPNVDVYYPGLGVQLEDAVTQNAGGIFKLPDGWDGSSLYIRAIGEATGASGNVFTQLWLTFGGIGTAYFGDNTTSAAFSVGAVTGFELLCDGTFSSANLAAGQIIDVYMTRYGGHGSDTYSGEAFLVGFIVTL
jgi:hypothetical protein